MKGAIEAHWYFAVSNKLQTELAANGHSSSLKRVQRNTSIGGIEQAVECSATGSHTDRHSCLGEPLPLHGGFDLAG